MEFTETTLLDISRGLELARCLRIANHAAHLAKVGAMKFIGGATPLEAAAMQAEYIAQGIKAGDDPGVCGCEEAAAAKEDTEQ